MFNVQVPLRNRTPHAPREVSNPQSLIPNPSLRGFTLIEMLVVVSIMMILVAVSASAFRPANDSRRIREAARQINLYLGSARNRAMETGRPCGVTFHCFGVAIPCAMTADQCETPPTFAGDALGAMVRVQDWTLKADNTSYWGDGSNVLKLQLRMGDFPENLLHKGDLIQLNSQGPLYTINHDPSTTLPTPDFEFSVSGNDQSPITFTAGVDTTPTDGWIDTTSRLLTLTLAPLYAQPTPWPTAVSGNWSQPVSFRIFRSPITGTSMMKGGARSLQLPAATVVDLTYSGFGATEALANDMTVLFAPNGSVQSVYIGGASTPVTEPIFLLVGKRERVPAPAAYDVNNPDTFANWQDLNNLWVVINPQTGLVTTGQLGTAVDSTFTAAARIASRLLAADSQGMGGK